MAVPQPPLRPGIGFCLQTDSKGTPPARWFVNVTKHKLVDLPIAYSGKRVDKEWILSHGLGNLQVPFDCGSFRKLKERSEGSRHTTYVVDVVFNPLVVQLFMDDEFCNKMEQYRPWVLNLALNRIDESIGVQLSPQVKLVKSFRYKDGESGDPSVAREFMDLPGNREDMGFESEYIPTPPSKPAESEAPLIQDVTPGVRKKPVVKKGFLNKKESAGYLYGEDGSKEGVLPENAGDPMGWMPKKLRQSSRIIDCNSPEYQAQEKARRAAESQNEMNKEMRDTIFEGFDKMIKKQDKWQSDLPEGTDAPAPCKYDTDYSRFNSIEDDDELDGKQADPERDWYYDAKGQQRPIIKQPEATGCPTAQPEATNPAFKKGFFENAKSGLYGEEGSKEGKTAGAPNQEAMMRELERLMADGKGTGGLDDEDMMRQLSDLMRTEGKTQPAVDENKVSGIAVKAPAQRTAPDFTLSEVDGNLSLVVPVPGLTSMQGVDLDVTERTASLTFPSSTGLRPLKVELPEAVVPTSTKAKFSKKTSQLTVTLPRKKR